MNKCFKISDERFSSERTDLYDLIFEVQFSRFRFIIKSNNSVIWLEDHFLEKRNDRKTAVSKINQLLIENEVLKTSFWKSITVISDFQIHMVIPSENYRENKKEEYIQIAYPTAVLEDFDFFSENSENQNIIFGTYREVNQIFREFYPEVRINFTSTNAVGFKYFCQNTVSDAMCVVSESFLDVYLKPAKNQSTVVLKVPLRLIETYSGYDYPAVLFGEVTPYSTIFPAIQEKFRHVKMGEVVPDTKLAGKFGEIASCRYFTLLTAK